MQTPRDAVMEISRKYLSKATNFLVCALLSHGPPKADFGVGNPSLGVCAILRVIMYPTLANV